MKVFLFMKRTTYILFMLLATAFAANCQTIKTTSLEMVEWGWHKNIIGWHSLNGCGYGARDNHLYFRTRTNRVQGLKVRDTLQCFNLSKGTIDATADGEGFPVLCADNSLKRFRGDYDKDARVLKLICDDLNPVSLATKSSETLLAVELVKHPDYALNFSVSPDSSKLGFFITAETDKKDFSHYFVVYDRLTHNVTKSEIAFKTSLPFYQVTTARITDKGELFAVLSTYEKKKADNADRIETYLVDSEGEALHAKFSLPDDKVYRSISTKVLHSGKMLWIACMRDKDRSGKISLYYSLVDGKDFEDSQVMNYEFADIWLEKQGVGLKNYFGMDVDFITELDNGQIMLTGFPYKIITQCSRNSCWNLNSWGGFFNLSMSPDGTIEKCSYIERMAKRMKSDLRSLQEDDLWYDVFNYGNDLYILFNESVKKVEKGKQAASYKPGEKRCYIQMYHIGEDGENMINLSGSTPTDFAYNTMLGRVDNKFYFLSRNNSFGSVSYIELPVVQTKSYTRKAGHNVVKKVVEDKPAQAKVESGETTSKGKTSPRKRTVKK